MYLLCFTSAKFEGCMNEASCIFCCWHSCLHFGILVVRAEARNATQTINVFVSKLESRIISKMPVKIAVQKGIAAKRFWRNPVFAAPLRGYLHFKVLHRSTASGGAKSVRGLSKFWNTIADQVGVWGKEPPSWLSGGRVEWIFTSYCVSFALPW